jgi:hypothetical protein
MEDSCQLHAPASLPLGKQLRSPLCRRLGGSQSRSQYYGQKRNLFLSWESNYNFSVVQPVAIPTELSWHLDNGISGVEFSGSETTALFVMLLYYEGDEYQQF